MKDNKRLDIMELAEDRFVDEADPTGSGISFSKSAPSLVSVQNHKPKFKWGTLIASVACLLLVLNVVIFAPILFGNDDPIIPSGDTAGTSDPLNQVQNPSGNDDPSKPESDNTVLVGNGAIIEALDKYFSSDFVENDDFMNDAQDKVEEELDGSLDGSLGTDVNDNQEAGISEGDIIKVSDKHIFYLKGKTLTVYTINGTKSELVAMIPLSGYVDSIDKLMSSLSPQEDMMESLDDHKPGWEMFLSPDYKTLTILAFGNRYSSNATGVLTFNVENAPSIDLIDFKTVSGKYVTSRMVNGELLLFTSYRISKHFDKSSPLSYMPFYIENSREHLAENVYFPGTVTSSSYLMVTRLGSFGTEIKESAAYLSYDDVVYVSENNIYITRTTRYNSLGNVVIEENNRETYDEIWSGSTTRPKAPHKTEIAVIGYKSDLFVNKGVIKIDGYLKNQYSLDEQDGILRAVTTTAIKQESPSFVSFETSASLYCIDLKRMTIVASVDNFAPLGEIVRSVRYEGDFAYVCTSYRVVLIDPVFSFDLSDLENITYTQTGEIDGYSSSLIDLGGGYIMGVGVGDTSDILKIEVFKDTGDEVISIDSYEVNRAYFSEEYKSYYVSREFKLIGLGVGARASSEGHKYLLLHFNGYELIEVINSKIGMDSIYSVRGFYRDGCYYVVTDKGLYTYDVGHMESLHASTSPAWPSV